MRQAFPLSRPAGVLFSETEAFDFAEIGTDLERRHIKCRRSRQGLVGQIGSTIKRQPFSPTLSSICRCAG